MSEVESKFYYTGLSSPLETIYDTVDTIKWTQGKDTDQYQILVDQSLILKDPMLAAIHDRCRGVMTLLMLPPKNMYAWHKDIENVCNISLYSSTENKWLCFYAENEYEHPWYVMDPPINRVSSYRPLLETRIEPRKWTMINAQAWHAGWNFNDYPVYQLVYCVKFKSGLVYKDVEQMVKQYKKDNNLL